MYSYGTVINSDFTWRHRLLQKSKISSVT